MCDDFDIKSLPWNFKSISKPTKTILKILEQKEHDYNKLIECMKRKIKHINIKVDEEIKKRAEVLKKKFSDVQEDVKMQFIDVRFKHGNLEIKQDYLQTLLNVITEFNNIEYEAVEEFCKSLRSLEENRSENFKQILKETKLNAIEVAHELPFALDEMFELEILALNQVTMSNYRHYSDIEKELKLQVKNHLKLWTAEIIQIKEQLKERLKLMAKKSLGNIQDALKDDLRNSRNFSFSEELHRLNSLKSEFNYAYFGEDTIPVTTDEVEKWLKDVQRTLASLDQSAKNIVALYKSMITVLFHRFMDELEEIKNSMKSTGICHKKEIEDFKCEIYTPAVDQLNIDFNSQLEELQVRWGDTIKDMTDTINSTYNFLRGAACLWDQHFVRIRDLQALVLKDIEKTINNNSCLTDTYEANVNVELEKLRQGNSEKALDKSIKEIFRILDKMEMSYTYQSYNEIDVVLKYKNMMDIEVEVLMSEINRFLIVHPQDLDRDPKQQRGRASQMSIKKEDDPLPMQILYCVFQVDAVKNWMFGLWEAINQYLSTGRQEIQKLTDEWINLQIDKINERLIVKKAFHVPRYQHIRCTIYDKRLRELENHKEQFNCHKQYIENKKKELKSYQIIYNEECGRNYQNYEEECIKILNLVVAMNSSSEIRGFKQMIKSRFEPLENNLKKLSDDYRLVCKNFMDEMKVSNYKYIQSLRLFSEGGNQSVQEASTLQKQISRLEEISIKQIQMIIEAIGNKEQEYMAKQQHAEENVIANLHEYVREYEFNEKLTRRINKLQINLKLKVKYVKDIFRSFEKKLYDVNIAAKKNMGRMEYLTEFLSLHETIIGELLTTGEFLEHPEPIDIFSLTSDPHILKNKQTNYTNQLFNKKSVFDDQHFITALVHILYNSFHDLETTAKDFYSKHYQRLLDATKLQPTLDDCMMDMLQKYKPYVLQCEICWMENISTFLKILSNFKSFTDNFRTAFEFDFGRICMKRFDEAIAKIWSRLNKKANDFSGKLKEIQNRLKVMFGHPRNYQLLQTLEEDYKEISEDNEDKFKAIIPPETDYLNSVYNIMCTQLEDMKQTISVLSDDNRIDQLIQQLSKQLEVKSEMLNPLVLRKETNLTPINKDMDNCFQKYVSICSNLNLDYSTTESVCPDTPSSNKTFENAEECLVTLREKIQTTKLEIEQFVQKKMVRAIEDFKKSWAEDIQYILNLYKVKYDNNIF